MEEQQFFWATLSCWVGRPIRAMPKPRLSPMSKEDRTKKRQLAKVKRQAIKKARSKSC